MPPALKWPRDLDVGEVMVPLEFCDPRDPPLMKGKWPRHPKRSHNFRTNSGQLVRCFA